MKKLIYLIFLLLPAILILSAWQQPKSLKGTWQFLGGIYNGKVYSGTNEYKLQRKYDAVHFDAFIIEPKEKPIKYQGGDYTLLGDTCLETETFSTQPSNLTGKTIHYHIKLNNDTLTFSGKLPSGMQVEEYWKKLK